MLKFLAIIFVLILNITNCFAEYEGIEDKSVSIRPVGSIPETKYEITKNKEFVEELILKNSTYKISLFILFAIVMLLVAFIFKFYIKLKDYTEEFQKLHKLSNDLPEKPTCAYLYFEYNKLVFCSPTFLKRFGLKKPLDKIEDLKNIFDKEAYSKLKESILYNINFGQLIFSKTKNQEIIINNFQTVEQGYSFILWFIDLKNLSTKLEELHTKNMNFSFQLKNFKEALNFLNVPIWFRDDTNELSYYNSAFKNIAFNSNNVEDLSADIALEAREENLVKEKKISINVEGERKSFTIFESPKISEFQIGYAVDNTKTDNLKLEIKRNISAQLDFISSISSAIAIYSSDTRLQMYNHAFVSLWQLDESFLDQKPTLAQILDLLRQKRKLPEQTNFTAYKQKQVDMFRTLTTVHNEFIYLPEGKILRAIIAPHALGGLLIAHEDISDKVELERSYNTLIEVLEKTLDNLQESIIVFSPNGNIKISNATFKKLWRLNDDKLSKHIHFNELINLTANLYNKPEYVESFKHNFLTSIEKRVFTTQKLELIDETVIERFIAPLPDGSLLITDLDITDSVIVERTLRERNEALQASDKIKTEFLANISYQLRSPITTVLGFSEMLETEHFGKLNDKQKEYVNYITSSSKEVSTLIDDIIELASFDAENIKLKSALISTKDLIDDIQLSLKNKFNNINVNFIDEANTQLKVDFLRFKQALYNIFNRVCVGNRNEQILVKLFNENSNVKIYIHDNSQTISKDEKSKYFDRFYKTEGEQIDNYFASGLALNIAKNIIEMHNGTIELESDINSGISITISIPRNT